MSEDKLQTKEPVVTGPNLEELFKPFSERVNALMVEIGNEISDQKALINKITPSLTTGGGRPGPMIFIASLFSNINSARSNQASLLKAAVDIIKLVEDFKLKGLKNDSNEDQIKQVLAMWLQQSDEYIPKKRKILNSVKSDKDIDLLLDSRAEEALEKKKKKNEEEQEAEVQKSSGDLVATKERKVYLIDEGNKVIRTFKNLDKRFKFFSNKKTGKLTRVFDSKKNKEIVIVKKSSLVESEGN